MKIWMAAIILVVVCLAVYWPSPKSEFVLDDYYTVVRNPLIKNPFLYKNIWTSRLFDAHQSSGYIKFGYYRPVLQSSWILDYRLFGLKAAGYKWLNLLIHALNCFLVYILLWKLFGQEQLALKACLLFCVLPTQEWVVRYVTGRGDELSALFALLALVCLVGTDTIYYSIRNYNKINSVCPYFFAFVFWALSALTREVAISYILYAFLIYFYCLPNSVIPNNNVIPAKGRIDRHSQLLAGIQTQNRINRFCLYWILIGILPLLVIWPIIPKLGNILGLHVLYFASIGFCLWMAQLRLRWVVVLFVLFATVSFYQGRFWTTEVTLLRHTRSLEWWPRTVIAQQLLMKYDDDIPAIKDLSSRAHDPMIKAMWLRRLGVVYFNHSDLFGAQQYFTQALFVDPSNVDALNALAVVYHQKGQEAQSLSYLNRALEINPYYPDTLRTLGIYYYIHKNFLQARMFLSRCLVFDPDNQQARELLGLAKAAH